MSGAGTDHAPGGWPTSIPAMRRLVSHLSDVLVHDCQDADPCFCYGEQDERAYREAKERLADMEFEAAEEQRQHDHDVWADESFA